MNLDDYLSRPGAQSLAAFARDLDMNPDQVRQWRHGYEGRRPSPESCSAIEIASQGAVSCEELRPDLCWSRISDADWPWNERGRPVLDVSKEAV